MSNKKPALGRGLRALLENEDTDIRSASLSENAAEILGSIADLDVTQIEANPFQPRTNFEEESLSELASSIKELGIIQPVTVRKTGYHRYQLISGERRFRASKLAGIKSIPAYIRVANDQELLEMALVENIQRESLDAIEISISFQRLIEECNLTQEKMSERVGKKRSTITNYLRLLKLPAEVQVAIRNQKITMGHARALVNIEDQGQLMKLFRKTMEEGLSVRKVEELARTVKTGSSTSSSGQKTELSFAEQKFLEDLNQYLRAKASIKKDAVGKGKLVIPFNSGDDLEKIIELMDL
ncbi:MAG: ParB/RepB/Spo0J family partition protein [Vicingaceae bacterium]